MGKKADQPKKRQRIDWEAAERDWRTGKFTQVEIAALHKIADPAQLSRRIKADQKADSSRWRKDLTEVVRQATNANLMEALVKSEVKEGQEKVKFSVNAVANVNTQALLRHHGDILDNRGIATLLLAELESATRSGNEIEELFDKVNEDADEASLRSARQRLRDHLSLHNRIASAHKLADTFGKLHLMERKTLNLDAAPPDGGPDSFEARVSDMP